MDERQTAGELADRQLDLSLGRPGLNVGGGGS